MNIPSTLCAISCLTLLACSSEGGPSTEPAPNGGGQQSSGSGGAGNSPSGGNGGSGATPTNGGAAQGGGASGGTPGAGSGGTPGAGAGGTPAGGGGSGGSVDDGDTPPWRPLNITAAAEEHVHNVQGRPAAVDNRAPIMMGKLIIDLGVDSGGIYQFGLRRGFHVYGADIEHCTLTYDNLEHNGDCRLETFDGIDHDPEFDLTPETAVIGRLQAALTELHATYPEEDWGYFLNEDGTVRLSDVGVTGYSHGAQSAARWARAYRLYRAVSRSGPRDNECGTGPAAGDYDAANPPWNTDCDNISAWLHETSVTPTERLFGFVGKGDGQYGDIMYSMEIMQYIGQPVNISTTQPPYPGDSHRFYADDGHSGFEGEEYWPALGVAWGVPPENMAYAAGL